MATLERRDVDRKIISVSPKRQITIPLRFFQQVGLGKEVECLVQDGTIVIRPLPSDEGEFTVEILRDLVARGYQGEELVSKFAEQKAKLKTAVGRMVHEADEIAHGKRKGATLSDVFGKE
jgi:bifunctional DNA-binding transcriptional regulator/antitoxin component of YhaV-PrlF toxin-antitoxin module